MLFLVVQDVFLGFSHLFQVLTNLGNDVQLFFFLLEFVEQVVVFEYSVLFLDCSLVLLVCAKIPILVFPLDKHAFRVLPFHQRVQVSRFPCLRLQINSVGIRMSSNSTPLLEDRPPVRHNRRSVRNTIILRNTGNPGHTELAQPECGATAGLGHLVLAGQVVEVQTAVAELQKADPHLQLDGVVFLDCGVDCVCYLLED